MNELTLLDSLFNRSFAGDYSDYKRFPRISVPNVDVTQTNDSYNLQMDLPGRTEKDVTLELDKNILTISSVKESSETKKDNKNEDNAEQPKWLIKERVNSSFSRRFSLPDDIDSENVVATFNNGVLNVKIARKAISAPKQIKITA